MYRFVGVFFIKRIGLLRVDASLCRCAVDFVALHYSFYASFFFCKHCYGEVAIFMYARLDKQGSIYYTSGSPCIFVIGEYFVYALDYLFVSYLI